MSHNQFKFIGNLDLAVNRAWKNANSDKHKDGKTEYGIDFVAEKIKYLDTKAPAGHQG